MFGQGPWGWLNTLCAVPAPAFSLGADNQPLENGARTARSEPFVPRTSTQTIHQEQPPLSMGPIAEQEWLSEHGEKYKGKWIALNGNSLVAHGVDGRAVSRAAKAAGVESPFIIFIEKEDVPFGGW